MKNNRATILEMIRKYIPSFVVLVFSFVSALVVYLYLQDSGDVVSQQSFERASKQYLEGLRNRVNEALLLDPEASNIKNDQAFVEFVNKQKSLIPIEGVVSELLKEDQLEIKEKEALAANLKVYKETVILGQDKWGLIATPQSGYYERDKRMELGVLFGGITFGTIVALYMALIIRQREIIQYESLEKDKLQTQLQISLKETNLAKELAEAASHAKSEFLANISHELRTPLHAIISFSRQGAQKIDIWDKERHVENLSRINVSGTRLSKLVNNLLDLAKLETGKVSYEMRETNILEVILSVKKEVDSLLHDKKLQIKIISNDSDNYIVVCDQLRIHQVILNLLSNAIKFCKEGGDITVQVVREQELELYRICVIDQGVGIPQTELEAVFDKFVQSSRTKTGAGGTGLGLAISKEIIEGHGGKIWASNDINGGAKFTFTLPFSYKLPEKFILDEALDEKSIAI